MPARVLAVVAAVVVAATAAASASAATICVPSLVAGCDSVQPTLAAAMTQANAAADPDQILLGAGAFAVSPGVAGLAGHPVQIIGAGMDRTVIEGTYGGGVDPNTLTLYGSGDSVSDLTIHEGATGHSVALYLDGASAQRVRADQRDHPGTRWAVELWNGATFADGEALASLGQGSDTPYGVQISTTGGQTSRVTGSTIQGYFGVATLGTGTAVVSRSRLTGGANAVDAFGAVTTVEDSTVAGGPLTVYVNGAQDASMTVRHVTLDAAQVQAYGLHDGNTAQAIVDNTAFVGGGPEFTQMVAQATGTGSAGLDVANSFYAGANRIDLTGTGATFHDGGGNVIGSDAGLVTATLRPRYDSPLVDAGGIVAGDEATSDLAGLPRTVNGRTDIGAYEYGRQPPTVTMSITPTRALVGEQVQFFAEALDADPGEIPAVTWVFDDGTTATGTIVTHAFASPGGHSVRVTATDPAGLTADATGSIQIDAPLVNKPRAPAFAFTRLRARGGVVRVALSCPATATDCAGRLTLRTRRVVLGRARYAVLHGTRRTIRVRLTRAARRRLARSRRGLMVRVVATPVDAPARSRTVRLTGR